MQQVFESVFVIDQKEKVSRRKKFRTYCIGLTSCIAIIVMVVIAVIDHRLPEPSIELPMIQEYGKIPLGFTKQ